MSKWLRPGEVNKKLIIVLVLLVIVAGIYWTVKMTGGDDTAMPPGEKQPLYCLDREEPFMLTAAEAKDLKKEGGFVESPETHKFECTWGQRPKPKSAGNEGLVTP